VDATSPTATQKPRKEVFDSYTRISTTTTNYRFALPRLLYKPSQFVLISLLLTPSSVLVGLERRVDPGLLRDGWESGGGVEGRKMIVRPMRQEPWMSTY
jgi:hypothetical protein